MFKIEQTECKARRYSAYTTQIYSLKRCIMLPQSKPGFPHRYNPDGTYDSICSTCFLTIATVQNEYDLAEIEATHICSQVRLNHFGRYPFLAGTHFDLLR
jgi:hypothetical protein